MESYLEVLKLFLMALGGVGLIGLLLYWTGTYKNISIKDVPEVRRQIRNELPDFRVSEIILSADRKTAVAAEKDESRIALVYGFGNKLAIRELGGRDLLGSRLLGGPGSKPLTLQIEVDDFARPRFAIVLYAPPSFALCLNHDRNPGDDANRETSSTQKARAIGEAWIDRIGKIADLAGNPHSGTAGEPENSGP